MINDHGNLFKIIIKLKKLVHAANTISEDILLGEAIQKIVNVTCELLNCDRASVFIADFFKNELFTKFAKDSGQIRIPIDKGIAGFNKKNI